MNIRALMTPLWFIIIGFWFFGLFTKTDWVIFVAGPIFIGLFSIIASKHLVDSTNELYAKRAEQMPFLFPRAFVGKTSVIFQRVITLFVGAAFILFGIANWIGLL